MDFYFVELTLIIYLFFQFAGIVIIKSGSGFNVILFSLAVAGTGFSVGRTLHPARITRIMVIVKERTEIIFFNILFI